MDSQLKAFTLLLLSLLLPLLATARPVDQGLAYSSPQEPIITIINHSPNPEAYDVETDSQAGPHAFDSCIACIHVPAHSTIRFRPGRDFNGALTAKQHKGSRLEINFRSYPGAVWYNVDMERGFSDETLGPTDVSLRSLANTPALGGERDTLGKANAAWRAEPDVGIKRALLGTGYFMGDEQWLRSVRMDLAAPVPVVEWLQLKAGYMAYVSHGSVAGGAPTEAEKRADLMNWHVRTVLVSINIY